MTLNMVTRIYVVMLADIELSQLTSWKQAKLSQTDKRRCFAPINLNKKLQQI